MQQLASSSQSLNVHRPDMFTVPQAAAYLAIEARTLDVWRSTKRVKIPYVKIGGAVRYMRADLDAYIESRRVAA